MTTDEFEFETTIDEALVNRLRANPKWMPAADGAYVEFTKIEMIECTPDGDSQWQIFGRITDGRS